MKMMLVIKKVHHMNRSAEQEFDENEMNEIYHFNEIVKREILSYLAASVGDDILFTEVILSSCALKLGNVDVKLCFCWKCNRDIIEII